MRSRRRLVEKYAKPESWVSLPAEAVTELSHEVAGLPSELDPENEEAKRFDLLLLNLQLARLRSEPGFARLRDQVKDMLRRALDAIRVNAPVRDIWWLGAAMVAVSIVVAGAAAGAAGAAAGRLAPFPMRSSAGFTMRARSAGFPWACTCM